MEFIIISGLSGAGKSKVASFLEDIGFYVVDNMPAPLMPKFAELCMAGPGRYDRVALVTDIRGGQTFDGLFDALHELHRMGCAYKILFVEASVETIIKRYKETRRMHPLSSTSRSLDEAVRHLDATNNQLPQDRESLFWMNVKAIPSMDKSKLTENTLQLAIISRIKLYYRPAKLALPPDQAAEKLRFRRSANSLTLINPTPYYLTVTELNAGTRVLENALVPPMGESTVKLPSDAGSNITYRTINDYGALTPKMTGVME